MSSRETIFSPDRIYRYTLWREISDLWHIAHGYVMFIGLNPSTADETKDDPTIRRCKRFAWDWGYREMLMTNLFAYRATKPSDMKNHPEPVGPENDRWLVECARGAKIVIAAWGVHGDFMGRDQEVLKLLGKVYCLGTTKDGLPRHPLMLEKTARPEVYR